MSTLEMIAHEVGVSAQTVSNVLNGKNKEKWGSTAIRAAKIREVAQRVGYQPNVMARAIATGQSRVFGLVTSGDGGGNDKAIQNGILEEITAQGYTAKLLHLPFSATSEDFVEVAQQCAKWRLEGLIAMSLKESNMPILMQHFGQSNCPVVFVGNIPPQNSLGVYCDIQTANRLAIQHLVDLGHRHIAFLVGPQQSLLVQRQVESFQSLLHEFGLQMSEDSVAYSSWTDADVLAASTRNLLNAPERATAIFAISGVQAMVVLSTARQLGLQLPRDLSVLCYSESATINYTDPPLTSLEHPSKQMGHLAVNQLLSYLNRNNEVYQAQPLCLKDGIRLVVRHSTASPPAP